MLEILQETFAGHCLSFARGVDDAARVRLCRAGFITCSGFQVLQLQLWGIFPAVRFVRGFIPARHATTRAAHASEAFICRSEGGFDQGIFLSHLPGLTPLASSTCNLFVTSVIDAWQQTTRLSRGLGYGHIQCTFVTKLSESSGCLVKAELHINPALPLSRSASHTNGIQIEQGVLDFVCQAYV